MVIRSAEKRVVDVPVSERLLNVYHELLAAYGPQGWWPASFLTRDNSRRNPDTGSCVAERGEVFGKP